MQQSTNRETSRPPDEWSAGTVSVPTAPTAPTAPPPPPAPLAPPPGDAPTLDRAAGAANEAPEAGDASAPPPAEPPATADPAPITASAPPPAEPPATAEPDAPPTPQAGPDPAPITAPAPPPADAATATAPAVTEATEIAPAPGASLQDSAIVVEDVTKRFNGFVAVAGMSLAVRPGTILGVIGPSGSGKTTTLRMMTGSAAPTSGRVRVLGEDPRHFRRATRERIGYMPQQFVLYPDLTVGENVDFVGSLFGLLWRRRRRRVRQVLDVVDLWSVRKRRASDLSGGMQRRLGLACALVHDPSLVILDEPTGGLDPLLRLAIWEELHRLKAAGRTLVVTTQYMGEAAECDMVALISEGRLIALSSPDDLRRDALGGEVVEMETEAPFDGRLLEVLPEVTFVRQTGPRNLLVTVADAASATTAVLAEVEAKGGEVAGVREYRPTFDDVFAALVGRHRAALNGDAAPAAAEREVAA